MLCKHGKGGVRLAGLALRSEGTKSDPHGQPAALLTNIGLGNIKLATLAYLSKAKVFKLFFSSAINNNKQLLKASQCLSRPCLSSLAGKAGAYPSEALERLGRHRVDQIY
jgi:hypothetical protein